MLELRWGQHSLPRLQSQGHCLLAGQQERQALPHHSQAIRARSRPAQKAAQTIFYTFVYPPLDINKISDLMAVLLR
jgi:hypothetical protein